MSYELQDFHCSLFLSILNRKMKNFKQLLIWQKGFKIAVQSFQLTATFPKEERFSLSNQITRAAVSISSNIAEGSSRESERDYHRFLEISLARALNWNHNCLSQRQ